MKRLIVLLGIMVLSAYANAASSRLLTVRFSLPDDHAKCVYMFFVENDQLHYQPDPISTNHCPRTLDLGSSTIDSISVTFPITNVPSVDTCTVKVNRLAPASPYVYSFYNSSRDCSQKVKVRLDQIKMKKHR